MTSLVFVEPAPASDYNRDVLQVLYAKRAEVARKAREAAEAAARALQADKDATAARMAPFGTYGNGTYAYRQCVWYVASRVPVPRFLGNARSWLYSLPATGYRQGPPRRGAIGITQAGYYGHAVLVEQVDGDMVLVSEYNYVPYSYGQRWVHATEFTYFYQ